MRSLAIVGVAFIFCLIFFATEGSSEEYKFDNLTVSKDETISFNDDTIWVQGDILVDGNLSITNCSVNINLTLDSTISEIRVNSTGLLSLYNATITTSAHERTDNETIISPYTIVVDAGNLNISNSIIDYGMLWLVEGAVNIDKLELNGFGMINYGIFSENTNLNANQVHIQNYTLGFRSIGEIPILESVTYYNCTSHMTQEWWVTFSPIEESTDLPISGFEIRQWDSDDSMVGTWYWAKEFEINSQGQKVEHLAKFSSYLNLYFSYIEDEWEQQITKNTDIVREYDMNHTNLSYDSATLFVDDIKLSDASLIVPKWSIINISVVVSNPTDLNFNNLYLDLEVNNQQAFARTSFKLFANTLLRINVTWIASLEGPLSLKISTNLINLSGNLSDIDISLSKFIEIEETISVEEKSNSWAALFAIIIILCLCSYVIYNDIEADDEIKIIDSSKSDTDVKVSDDSMDDDEENILDNTEEE